MNDRRVNNPHVNNLRWRLDELGPIGAMLEHEIHMVQRYYGHVNVRDTHHNILEEWRDSLMPHFENAYFLTRGHSDIKDEIKKVERRLFTDDLTV